MEPFEDSHQRARVSRIFRPEISATMVPPALSLDTCFDPIQLCMMSSACRNDRLLGVIIARLLAVFGALAI